MPKIQLHYTIRGDCTCTVDAPQSVIDQYNRMCEGDPSNGRAIDRLLEGYVDYDNVVEQLDEAEDIELTELKEAAQSAE